MDGLSISTPEGGAERGAGDPLGSLARSAFGVDYLFPLQRLVMANILDAAGGEARDAPLRQAAILPTGFGKSLCFQLPALLLQGPTVVVYPLLALMEDQRRRLESRGIPRAVFRGGQDKAERADAEGAVESGKARIVITNPECLQGRVLDFLAACHPSHVAIDEAHCVSEWGESFRPAYLGLGDVLARLDPPAATAFTATASPLVLESMTRILFGGAPGVLVEGDPDRPNISYEVRRSLARERALEATLRDYEWPAIVFTGSRSGAEILAERLRRRLGTKEIRFYHAGLSKEEKKTVETWFFDSESAVLVSTCAYGMGMDKGNVRTVVHWDPPPSIEAYLQESGRAGRDGLPARAVLILGPSAREAAGREADPALRARRTALVDYAEDGGHCRRETLLGLLGAELRSPCSGCDVCEDRSPRAPEGEAEILRFARANSRRHDEAEAIRLLLGEGGEPPRCLGSGGLLGWRKEDVVSALLAARGAGLVDVAAKGAWKGRLAAGIAVDH